MATERTRSQNTCDTLSGDSRAIWRNLKKLAVAKKCCLVTVIVICFYSWNEVVWKIQKTCRSNNDDCDNSYFIFYVVLRIVSVK